VTSDDFWQDDFVFEHSNVVIGIFLWAALWAPGIGRLIDWLTVGIMRH